MRFISETSDTKQPVLIVDKASTQLSKVLKTELEKYDNDIFISPHLPRNADDFDYVFYLNPDLPIRKIETKLVLIFTQKKQSIHELQVTAKKNPSYRIISISGDAAAADLEKILWFSFTKSQENFLRVESFAESPKKIRKPIFKFDFKKGFNRRNIITTIILFIVFYNLFLFLFISSTLFAFYKSAKALTKNQIDKSQNYLGYGSITLALSKSLYAPLRAPYHFLSIALLPDNAIDISSRTGNILQNSLNTYDNGTALLKQVFKKDKTVTEKQELLTRIAQLRGNMKSIHDDLLQLNEKIPPSLLKLGKLDIGDDLDLLEKTQAILPFAEDMLAKGTQKKYLLLFANNMEIRPGGGFIGSFGVITVSDLTVNKIDIYDVYDADGQLKKHVEPPSALRKHLDQPNWFLRDSAFSPDFFDNYTQAKAFLNEEVNLSNFDGGFLLTTSAIQNLIGAYDNLFIPDFNETVNKDNFYIKAQLYSEKDFFPGSIQKKNFLGAVANQILINIEDVSPPNLFRMVKKSLDEKQMAVYFDDPKIQAYFDSLYWSGKMISPRCIDGSSDCVLDYIFPVDANLGVNKANFFVSRDIDLKVRIENDGRIKNILSITIKNESPNNVFPGGTYKNYFQIFLPSQSVVDTITRNNTLIETYDESQGEYKTLGFLLEIPPQKTTELKITYELLDKIQKKSTYQLIFQKQIGSKNSDLKLEFALPGNISVSNQNFAPLVKGNSISYNTSLSADKIFLIQFERK